MSSFLGSLHGYNDPEELNRGALQEKSMGHPWGKLSFIKLSFSSNTGSVSSLVCVIFSGICCQHTFESHQMHIFCWCWIYNRSSWFVQIKKHRMRARYSVRCYLSGLSTMSLVNALHKDNQIRKGLPCMTVTDSQVVFWGAGFSLIPLLINLLSLLLALSR